MKILQQSLFTITQKVQHCVILSCYALDLFHMLIDWYRIKTKLVNVLLVNLTRL